MKNKGFFTFPTDFDIFSPDTVQWEWASSLLGKGKSRAIRIAEE
jgi:hypothetical protein